MRNFTPTEIDLCKKIVKKERRRVDEGDWYLCDSTDVDPTVYLAGITSEEVNVVGIPLWQEHDCLEWLREEGEMGWWNLFRGENLDDIAEPILEDSYRFECQYIRYIDKSEKGNCKQPVIDTVERMGKTPLEALLHAVLAVMEGK